MFVSGQAADKTTADKMTVDIMTTQNICRQSVYRQSDYRQSAYRQSFCRQKKVSIDKLSVDKLSVDEFSVDKIRDNYRLIPLKPLFISKGNSSMYYPFLINLAESDYQETKITPKSKLERMSSTIKLDLKYINALNTSDLITDYLITKFKIENNLI